MRITAIEVLSCESYLKILQPTGHSLKVAKCWLTWFVRCKGLGNYHMRSEIATL